MIIRNSDDFCKACNLKWKSNHGNECLYITTKRIMDCIQLQCFKFGYSVGLKELKMLGGKNDTTKK